MATTVETQRLISVSLGKIARSRGQRGGINLHKNLLVASVLNKARTAFMMENYTQQLQHQKQQQVILTTPQPTPVSPSPAADSGNSLPSHVAETCQTTPDVQTRSAPIDTPVSSELVNGGAPSVFQPASNSNTTEQPISTLHDKENISPSTENVLVSSTSPVTESLKQNCVSGEQHIEAANQLSQDAQLAATHQSLNSSSSSSSPSSCKQQFSASPSCASVLKRRRENPEAAQTQISCESDCPSTKKARVASSSLSSSSSSSSSDCSYSYSQSCEVSSESDRCESEMQTTDSPQISNLVSIFNSGFSGLCNPNSSSSSSLDYESSCCYQSDNSSSMSHPHQSWANSMSSSENQSLHCSSMVERIGAISSAIVLSA